MAALAAPPFAASAAYGNFASPFVFLIPCDGDWLIDKKRDILYKLAKSKNLWERRIAIISTFTFIRNNQFEDTLKISKILLTDKHDLIHKAVGWMLREVGKRNKELLKNFLDKNYQKMPKIMLRYAIEKFNNKEKEKYLK